MKKRLFIIIACIMITSTSSWAQDTVYLQSVNKTICEGGNLAFAVTLSNASNFLWQVATDTGAWTDLGSSYVCNTIVTISKTITGATKQVLSASTNGDYAAILVEKGSIDTIPYNIIDIIDLSEANVRGKSTVKLHLAGLPPGIYSMQA